MRSVWLKEHGGPEVLPIEKRADPTPGPDSASAGAREDSGLSRGDERLCSALETSGANPDGRMAPQLFARTRGCPPESAGSSFEAVFGCLGEHRRAAASVIRTGS